MYALICYNTKHTTQNMYIRTTENESSSNIKTTTKHHIILQLVDKKRTRKTTTPHTKHSRSALPPIVYSLLTYLILCIPIIVHSNVLHNIVAFYDYHYHREPQILHTIHPTHEAYKTHYYKAI